MNKLKYLIVHCTLTPPSMKVTKDMLKLWHMGKKEDGHRGWSRLGYSDIIHRDGIVQNLTPYNEDEYVQNHEMTWGASGVNSISRHIVLSGGLTEEGKSSKMHFSKLYTIPQFYSLAYACYRFLYKHPDCKIGGHYQFANKGCPNFDIQFFLRTIGIDEKNIVQ